MFSQRPHLLRRLTSIHLTAGPPPFLLHSLGCTHAFYRPIIPILSSRSYNSRYIAYDSIASGLSDCATELESIRNLSEDVIGLLDALKAISRHAMDMPVLVRHLMAGISVAELAATHPRMFGD